MTEDVQEAVASMMSKAGLTWLSADSTVDQMLIGAIFVAFTVLRLFTTNPGRL